MADENTPNPANLNPNPPTGDADAGATPPPTEKVSPPSELTAEAEVRPAAEAEAPVEEVAKTETAEAASEVAAQPAEVLAEKVEAEETSEIPTEKVEEVSAETSAEKVVEQPEVEAQPEQPEIAAAAEEVIQGAPAKPGDKIETAAPPPAAETSESPSAGNIPPKTEKDPPPKSGFKPDGITPLDGEEKIFAAVGYVGILALLPLLARRDSEFAQHHGRQGLVVAIIFIVLWLFAKLGGTLSTLVFVLQFAAIVGGFVLAYKGDWFRIPGIYDLSLKIKLRPPQSQKPSDETENSETAETLPPQN